MLFKTRARSAMVVDLFVVMSEERRVGIQSAAEKRQQGRERVRETGRPMRSEEVSLPLNSFSSNLFTAGSEPSELLLFHSKFDQPCPLNLLPATLP
jgi:hypothetical protein